MTIKWALRRPRSLAVIATAAVITGVVVAAPAGGVGAGTNYPNIVNAVPFTNTPNMTDGTVFAINQVGNMIFAGGSFTNVQNHGSTTNLGHAHLVGFDAATGAVSTTFAPTIDGTVEAIAPGPVANTVYVAGVFSTVNGIKSKGITLLSTTTGAIAPGFKPPALNGIVYSIALAGGRLYLAGSFTTANTIPHGGLATLNPTTGALDAFMSLQTAGHHNYNGTGANGAVGPRAMAVNPAGTRAVVIGNFKTVGGVARDQAVMIDLDGASAAVDPNWGTVQYTAPCARNAFDTYMTDVQYSADGSYFAITATGGGFGSRNTDNSLSLCDSAARWESSDTGSNVKPTWVDYTGNDTLWSVAIAGNAIYVGGHERWLNNSNASDRAGSGAVPRPGMGALDPLSGVPLAWNPGRNPRGAGAYAMFVGTNGLYVGSDTDYIGNNKYKHQKLAYFPLSGGLAPAATTTASLPSNVYEVSPGAASSNVLQYRSLNGSTVGPTSTVGTSISWSTSRGAFMAGNSIFYGTSDGQSFFRASFNGSTVGSPVLLDPYDDPYWDSVQTGSGQTYQGVKSGYYGEMSGITGAFYSNGKLFYSRSGLPGLYWRWFSPDSGTIGSQEFSATSGGFSFANVSGMVLSGTTLYYANKGTGALQSIPFDWSKGTVSGAATTVDNTVDWRARSLFLNGSGAANQAPVAAATVTCNGLTCSFNGSASHDADGTITAYAWDFGDGSQGTGQTQTHTYAASQAGGYPVTLTVTDNSNAQSAPWTGTANPASAATAVNFVAESHFNGSTASPAVTVPAAVSAGDTELLYVATAASGVTTTPSGWTKIAQETNAPLEATVFERVAGAGDSSSVTVPLTAAGRVDLHLVAYSGVAGGTPISAVGGDSNTATHSAPAVNVPAGGSWVVNYWSDRTSFASPTTWTLQPEVTDRGASSGTGGGHTDSQIADSGAPFTGAYAAKTATANEVSGKGAMVTIVLTPGT
jgi:PKD domain-containing protein